tara:strand:+ start:737 stop:847 length:111 start_codon:yes stop_codon:yes gene_type:complete
MRLPSRLKSQAKIVLTNQPGGLLGVITALKKMVLLR